ncbi:MAG: M48 family metallopeptidase [Quisquiliibacterium sp.]
MTPIAFSAVFAAALLATLGLKLWLAVRQVRHVAQHRGQVPPAFAERIALHAHQRAADYTIARTRLGLAELFLGTAVVVGFTLLGGLQWLHRVVVESMPAAGIWRQLVLLGLVGLISSVIDLPLAWYRQFRLEERFGFNRMTVGLWAADLAKGALLSVLLGLPLAAAVLWLMRAAGPDWWFHAWLVWIGFNVLVLLIYPTVIAPMFNKFEPLRDETLRARIEALMSRCGFASRGLFVMDGSRRSAHGNAYFTGFGRSKRIVFFDTLIERLSPPEIEAVLAHELGHFKCRHVLKRLAFSFAISLAGLWLLGALARQSWFFQGLGVIAATDQEALALILFLIAMPTFSFLLQPILSLASRRHEFEADAFAASQAEPVQLVSALVKLYQDNAATLTPDPLHSAFYDSHPPAAQRVGRLERMMASSA